MSGDGFWLSRLGRLLASSRQRPRMLLNILPQTGQPPMKKKKGLVPSVSGVEVEKL